MNIQFWTSPKKKFFHRLHAHEQESRTDGPSLRSIIMVGASAVVLVAILVDTPENVRQEGYRSLLFVLVLVTLTREWARQRV